MRHTATIVHTADAGPIDLGTIAGIDRAMEIATSTRDRGLFLKLLALRREAAPAPTGSLLGAIRSAHAALRGVAADVARLKRRDPRGMRRDLDAIGAALAAFTKIGARRAEPAEPVCPECGQPDDEWGECFCD